MTNRLIGESAHVAAQAAYERLTQGSRSWWRALFPRLAAPDWPAKRDELVSAVHALDVSCETIYRHAVGAEIERRPYRDIEPAAELALAVFRTAIVVGLEQAGRRLEATREARASEQPAPAPRGLERTAGPLEQGALEQKS